MVSQNSKKIKKPSKFNELVQQKSQKKTKVVENRNALLKEYKSRNKNSKVEDRRFLANRDAAQKALGPIERGKKKKMAFFNLDSDDEDLNLTHKGVNLDELDDFKDNEIEKSISDDEGINADMVANLHFEGFEEGDKDEEGFQERRKSKQEIYKELIQKSKKAKYLRQKAAEEAEEKIEELDEGFESIAHLLIRNPNQYKEQKQAQGKQDAYLKLQNELAYDKCIKPEAANTVDPKLAKKKKKENQLEEESEGDSELGIEDDKPQKMKQRKLQGEVKIENKTKKFMSFMDDIRNLKNAKGKNKDDDSLDELEVDSEEEEEEGDEYEDEGEEEDDGEGMEEDEEGDEEDDE